MENSELIKKLRLRLGEPLVAVELLDEQIDEAIKIAEEDYEFISSVISYEERKEKLKIKDVWIKRYSLAICKEMLGRVRGKFDSTTVPSGTFKMDAKSLIKESTKEKNFLIRMCLNNSFEKFVLLNREMV